MRDTKKVELMRTAGALRRKVLKAIQLSDEELEHALELCFEADEIIEELGFPEGLSEVFHQIHQSFQLLRLEYATRNDEDVEMVAQAIQEDREKVKRGYFLGVSNEELQKLFNDIRIGR